MSREEAKKALRAWLGFEDEPKATEVTLKDGSKATVDTLEVGGVLTIGEGPANDGEYELGDGRIIVMSDGKIAEVREAAETEETPEESEVEAAEETPAEETNDEATAEEAQETEDLEPRIAAIETAVDELYNLVGQLTEAMREKENGMNESIAEFKKELQQPSAAPVHFAQNTNENMSQLESRVARIKELRN